MGENTVSLVCDKCKKKYTIKDISEIAKFWGIIHYVGDEHSLLGLTCIECQKTTISRFKNKEYPHFLNHLRGIRRENIQGFHQILPFSYEILAQSGIDDLLQYEPKKEGEEYKIPDGFRLACAHIDKKMPDCIRNIPTSLWASDIPKLREIENTYNVKSIPRLSWKKSIYKVYDPFLYETTEDFTADDYRERVRDTFYGRLFFYYCLTVDSLEIGDKNLRNHFFTTYWNSGLREMMYSEIIKNSNAMNDHEFEEIHSYIGFYGHADLYETDEKLARMKKDYLKIRNNLNFEITYRDDFFYKYSREIYYHPGWLEELSDDMMSDFELEPEEMGVCSPHPKKFGFEGQPLQIPSGFDVQKNLPNDDGTSQSEKERVENPQDEIEKTQIKELQQKHKVKENFIIKQGATWLINFKGDVKSFKDIIGIRLIANLVAKPNEDINYFVLEEVAKMNSDTYEDAEKKVHSELSVMKETAYEENISREELKEWEEALNSSQKEKLSSTDEGEISENQAGIDKIIDHLKSRNISVSLEGDRYQLKGRTHKLRDMNLKLKKRIKQNIKNSYKDIKKELPGLEKYLRKTIKSGNESSIFQPGYYFPVKGDPSEIIEWTVIL